MGSCPSNRANNSVIKPTHNGIVLTTLIKTKRMTELLPPPSNYFDKSKIKNKEIFILIL